MSKWSTIKRIHRRSLIATNRANLRWKRDRERRDALAAAAPRIEYRIVERIVVIRDECRSREIVRYEHETERDWRRKRR